MNDLDPRLVGNPIFNYVIFLNRSGLLRIPLTIIIPVLFGIVNLVVVI